MRELVDIEGYLAALGVSSPSPCTVAFDPGYDPSTLKSHLLQSRHLLYGLKLSMATWQLSSYEALSAKVDAITCAGLSVIAGGGPFEVAASFNRIESYFDLCSSVGFTRVEVGEGFSSATAEPESVVRLAEERGLKVQFEVGRKFGGSVQENEMYDLCKLMATWLSAGAQQIVVEAREDALDVGVFDGEGILNRELADRMLRAVDYDLRRIQFEAPTKRSQFALIEHFGKDIILANVRLEEILRLETFRRGLHPNSFMNPGLRPRGPGRG